MTIDIENLEADLLKAGLLEILRNRYLMPDNMPDFSLKYETLKSLFDKIEKAQNDS